MITINEASTPFNSVVTIRGSIIMYSTVIIVAPDLKLPGSTFVYVVPPAQVTGNDIWINQSLFRTWLKITKNLFMIWMKRS